MQAPTAAYHTHRTRNTSGSRGDSSSYRRVISLPRHSYLPHFNSSSPEHIPTSPYCNTVAHPCTLQRPSNLPDCSSQPCPTIPSLSRIAFQSCHCPTHSYCIHPCYSLFPSPTPTHSPFSKLPFSTRKARKGLHHHQAVSVMAIR